jgi:hypothetical protein
MRTRTLALALATLGLVLAGCGARGVTSAPFPAPTQGETGAIEHRLDDGAEARQKDARKRWMAHMHRTASDVDWRAIERENGMREQARRNALGRLPQNFLVQAWTEVGSKNQAGRMHCGTIGPDGSTLYAGSSLGGLWRADLNGAGWTPLGDNLYGGVHEVLALPGEFAGEPDVLITCTDGGLVRVTRDLGQIWETPAGLSGVHGIRGVALLQDPARTILVCGQNATWGNSPAVYGSTDYGRTFVKRWQAPQSGNGWMWVPRRGSGAATSVYLVNRGRQYVSGDGGWSFAPLALIDPLSDAAVLAGSEAGAPTLYAALRSSGAWKLYRSDDAGGGFAFVQTLSDFWEALCASSVSSQVVVYGGVEARRSANGGSSFALLNSWTAYYGDPLHKLHADMMGLHAWPDPVDPSKETWYYSTDGGIYRSAALGLSPLNLSMSGLGVSQYYSTLSSSANNDLIVAGSQDQGYQRGLLQPSSGSGPSTSFAQLISGDYGHLTSSDGTHQLVYSTYPGFILVQEGETNPNLLYPWLDFPAGSQHAWLPPVVADPLDKKVFYFCGDRLTRYTRVSGAYWSQALHSTQAFAVGGGSYVSALAFAPTDPQRVYAANDSGRLFWSANHGVSWTQSGGVGPSQQYFYGSTISVHPTDPLEVAVGGSGYSTPAVIRSSDGGQSWSPEVSGLPPTLVYGLAYARDGSGDLYAGTETGAYAWRRSSGQWENIMGNEAPITIYWSVEAVGSDVMRFGTYGRGIWDFAVHPPAGWTTYGTGKLGSQGAVPQMGALGTPSLAAGGFSAEVIFGVPSKPGVLMYSGASASTPFQGGTLLLAPPVQRGPTFQLDIFGYAAVAIAIQPPMVGQTVFYQAWMRDPQHPDGTGVGLSNGLQVTYGP